MTKPQPLFISKQVWQIPDTQLEVSTNQYGEVELSNDDKLILTLPAKKAEGLAHVLSEAAKNCKSSRRKPKAQTTVVEFKGNAGEAISTKVAQSHPVPGPILDDMQREAEKQISRNLT